MSEIACFSELETIKSRLLDTNTGKEAQNAKKSSDPAINWEKVWAVLWKSTDGWKLSVWNRKELWKAGAAPLASLQLSKIQMFSNTAFAGRSNVLKLQFDNSKEWIFCCPSDSMLNKWTNTIREKLALYLQCEVKKVQDPLVVPQWNQLAGWEGDTDDNNPLEELRLLLVKCSTGQQLTGSYVLVIHQEYIYVMKVKTAIKWQWSWSDIEWYSLNIGSRGKQVVMKTASLSPQRSGVFTWSGTSAARFFAILMEHIPEQRVEHYDNERRISIAEESLTSEQLDALKKGLFAVEMSCSKNQSCDGSYNMTFTDTTILLLSVDSSEEKWKWSFTEIQEFTLDVDDGRTVLSLTINSGDYPGVYVFFGERISLVFLIIRELTGRLAVEMERKEQVMEEYEGGICINISARVLELMQLTYKLTLTESNSHSDHVGQYLLTLTRDTISLTNVSSHSKSWKLKLEHVRRFHLERKTSKSMLLIETGRRSCMGEGLFIFDGDETELTNLCVVFKELINRLMVVVKIQHTLIQIKQKLIIKLRNAGPRELLEAVPVILMGDNLDHSPDNQHALHVYSTELKLLDSTGLCVGSWTLESISKISMETGPDSSSPLLVLNSSDNEPHSSRLVLSCKDPIATYSMLKVMQEQNKNASQSKKKSGHVVLHIKNAFGHSICDGLCDLVLEEESIKLFRVKDGRSVWELELVHIISITVEEHSDGLGVLMMQTSRKSPYGGQQYHLLCQEPDKVFNDILSYAEKYKGQVVIHEHEMIGSEEVSLLRSQVPPTLLTQTEVNQIQQEEPYNLDISDDNLVEDATGETIEEMTYRLSRDLKSLVSQPRRDDWTLHGDEEDAISEDDDPLSTEDVELPADEHGCSVLVTVPDNDLTPMEYTPYSYVTPDNTHLFPDVKCTGSTLSIDSDVSDDVFLTEQDTPTMLLDTPTQSMLDSSRPFVNLAHFREHSKSPFIPPATVFQSSPFPQDLQKPSQKLVGTNLATTDGEYGNQYFIFTIEEERSTSLLESTTRCGQSGCRYPECEIQEASITFGESEGATNIRSRKTVARRMVITPTHQSSSTFANEDYFMVEGIQYSATDCGLANGDVCPEFKLQVDYVESLSSSEDDYSYVTSCSIVCEHYILMYDGESPFGCVPFQAHLIARDIVDGVVDDCLYGKMDPSVMEAWQDKDTNDATREEDPLDDEDRMSYMSETVYMDFDDDLDWSDDEEYIIILRCGGGMEIIANVDYLQPVPV